ncbi:hypothetical protein Bca52824_022487 [Brassica carinata]|uniref:Glycosyltransferase subfamily 4-like N-terminal domain-containing protein n=1 Tax=Brassica carinata TaxID=52824 RepID=A0A8X8ART8_BRACI|nr:hypothetical protein Bca52824_022487 [Brassica carinata]
MARENPLLSFSFSLRYLCHFTLLISVLSFVSFLFRHNTTLCSFPYDHNPNADHTFDHSHNNETIDLLTFSSAWNHLTFFPSKPKKILKIAVVVKKWPQKSQAGGLERHALTLHLALANRGHEVHVFTTKSPSFPEYGLKNLRFHLSEPTSGGYLDQASLSQELQVNIEV